MSILMMGKSLVTVSLCGLVALALALRAVVRAHRGGPEGPALARSSMDASLFWGAAAFAVGLLHTVLGLIVTLLSIRAAAPVGPGEQGLIATGLVAALAAVAYGLLVFVLVAFLWFGFRHWQRRGPVPAT